MRRKQRLCYDDSLITVLWAHLKTQCMRFCFKKCKENNQNRALIVFEKEIKNVLILTLSIFNMLYSAVFDNSEVCNIFSVCFFFINRFLLARHKAAIELYNEATKLSERDWVLILIIHPFIH